jgi:hypothetical protein
MCTEIHEDRAVGPLRKIRFVTLLLTLALSGCDVMTGPTRYPSGALEWVPPDNYAALYEEVQTCIGRRGPIFESIRWFLVPTTNDLRTFDCDGFEATGCYYHSDRRLYLVQGDEYTIRLVKHELVHAAGITGHPAPPFGTCDLPSNHGEGT